MTYLYYCCYKPNKATSPNSTHRLSTRDQNPAVSTDTLRKSHTFFAFQIDIVQSNKWSSRKYINQHTEIAVRNNNTKIAFSSFCVINGTYTKEDLIWLLLIFVILNKNFFHFHVIQTLAIGNSIEEVLIQKSNFKRQHLSNTLIYNIF